MFFIGGEAMFDILKEPVEIRLGKAKNTKTSPELLDELSHDSFWFVRDFVARNPNTAYKTLEYLRNDSDHRVKYEAEKNICLRNLDNVINIAEKKKFSAAEKTEQQINRSKEIYNSNTK